MAKKNENSSIPSVVPAKRPVRRSSRTIAPKRPRKVQPGSGAESVTETVIESEVSLQQRKDQGSDMIGDGIGILEHSGNLQQEHTGVGYLTVTQQGERRVEEVAEQREGTEMHGKGSLVNDLTPYGAAKQLRHLNGAVGSVDGQAGPEGSRHAAETSHPDEEHQAPPVPDTDTQLDPTFAVEVQMLRTSTPPAATSSSQPAMAEITAALLQQVFSASEGDHLGDKFPDGRASINSTGYREATAEAAGTTVQSEQFTAAGHLVSPWKDSATIGTLGTVSIPSETEKEREFNRQTNHIVRLEIYAEQLRSQLSAKAIENEALERQIRERDKRIEDLEKALVARAKESPSAMLVDDMEGLFYTDKNTRIQELEGCVVDQAIMTVSQAKEIKKLREALKEHEAGKQDAHELKSGFCDNTQTQI
ncbi:hypothetical protein BDW74DRAFT_172852 [Aspergillus multicolor]|uniref:uncharacterized protein n=1 Tax=Aspergillus multicolor TaxID=41759 RepID=UPI003CCDAC0B